MAIEFQEDEDLGGQSGGQLRAKLEEALQTNKALAEENTLYKARDVLTEKGFDLVKAEDLKGVAPDKIEEHASKLQQDRKTLQENLLRDALSKQGFEGDELDAALQRMVGEQTQASEEAEATRRVREAGSVQGSPVPRVNPEKLHGYDAIRAAMEKPATRRS